MKTYAILYLDTLEIIHMETKSELQITKMNSIGRPQVALKWQERPARKGTRPRSIWHVQAVYYSDT
jgi:hypothetical protein